MVEVGSLPIGYKASFMVIKGNKNPETGEPYAIALGHRYDLVSYIVVYGGTQASVKAQAQEWLRLQFTRFPS